MNWKDINERYPKAFLEWMRVYMKDKYIKSAVVGNFAVRLGYELSGFSYAHTNRMNEQVYKLPYYFDTLGITIDNTSFGKVKDFDCWVGVGKKCFYAQNGYPDRLSATIAGAEKAFEIREAQLNTI